jgi:hypothetical protein
MTDTLAATLTELMVRCHEQLHHTQSPSDQPQVAIARCAWLALRPKVEARPFVRSALHQACLRPTDAAARSQAQSHLTALLAAEPALVGTLRRLLEADSGA